MCRLLCLMNLLLLFHVDWPKQRITNSIVLTFVDLLVHHFLISPVEKEGVLRGWVDKMCVEWVG